MSRNITIWSAVYMDIYLRLSLSALFHWMTHFYCRFPSYAQCSAQSRQRRRRLNHVHLPRIAMTRTLALSVVRKRINVFFVLCSSRNTFDNILASYIVSGEFFMFAWRNCCESRAIGFLQSCRQKKKSLWYIFFVTNAERTKTTSVYVDKDM